MDDHDDDDDDDDDNDDNYDNVGVENDFGGLIPRPKNRKPYN